MDSNIKNGLIVTVVLAAIGGAYKLGESSSKDTVGQLEKSLASYEKADKLNTEEFINSSISAANELKLSIEERKKFSSNNLEIIKLKNEIKKHENANSELNTNLNSTKSELLAKDTKYQNMINDIKNSNDKILSVKDENLKNLNAKLMKYEASYYKFSLDKGEGVTLKNGLIQVGYSNDNSINNICDVTINNKFRTMKAGDSVSIENCKITITRCSYNYSNDSSANFELYCS